MNRSPITIKALFIRSIHRLIKGPCLSRSFVGCYWQSFVHSTGSPKLLFAFFTVNILEGIIQRVASLFVR